MSRKIKYSKIAIVALLTVLIWVWADLAVDETLLVPNVSISIVKSSNPALWAAFQNEGEPPVSSISMKHIVLKGPTSRIAEVERELSNGMLDLDFSLNPELIEMTTPGSHPLTVLDFLRNRSSEIGELTGVTVESCEPNTLTVNVEMLVETSLTVGCFFDESRRSQDFESITPATVTMFLPKNWGRERPARVELTPAEIERARSEAIEKIPFVVLADGQKRYAGPVQVKMPPAGDLLEKLKVGGVGVSFCFSPITQGKYRVVLDNRIEVMSEIGIRATQQAKDEYEAMIYQVRLEIYDDDAEATDWVSRELKYDFPDEYVRRNQIVLDQDPVTVRFKLERLASNENP
ncbi:MAG: hypothetical protein AMJ65_04680 [Phycisphaerae bacterium SG8_4]|nr:MAG: hypothetical protein AMJ65_04680 [Phycisphaerae bacterium SG8_4]